MWAVYRITQPSWPTHMCWKQLLRHLSWGGESVVPTPGLAALSSMGPLALLPFPSPGPQGSPGDPLPCAVTMGLCPAPFGVTFPSCPASQGKLVL